MSDPQIPDEQRTTEFEQLTETPAESDPADLTGVAAESTADQMHGEVDEIAADADESAPGHGPAADEA